MSSMIREKQKRKRNGINKKWTCEEIRCILNYLENSSDVEVPTAQIYYRKFISETGINASWDLVRWKVKNLKRTYKKALDWRISSEARSLECDEGTESVNARILRICPQFHQLNNIFGERMKTEISWHEIVNTVEPIETSCIKIDADEIVEAVDILGVDPTNCSSYHICHNSSIKDIPFDNTSNLSERKTATNNFRQKTIQFSDGIKKSEPKSITSFLADFQVEKTSLFKMKLEWERHKHIEEMEINRRRLALDEETTKADIMLRKQELELKTREIERRDALEGEKTKAEIEFKTHALEMRVREFERDERLKVLEMEKDERIKKYEIEMKLKYQNYQP